ncbi:MAG: two-component sensor histidine kinase [Proteobacteria bacterium]|nr:two-component sensor histidine kinase [Pseudomonadota bacterium]
MNTLRAKLVLLLAVAIISVVGVLTGVLLYLFRPPGGQHMGPVADQVLMLKRIAEQSPTSLPLSDAPAAGKPRPEITRWLKQDLDARGAALNVAVTRSGDSAPQVVSIPVNGAWLHLPIPDLPPPDGGWHVLINWLALITLGALAIAIFVANRMIQPLVLLEKAIASVGPDALMPELPVKGPAEVKVAAKALNSLSSRLKDAMESRMRLVAAAGHDMRTPITRMRLRAEFVTEDDDRAMWLKDIDELERIADSAIVLVREESGASHAETVRLDDLVSGIVGELRGLSYKAELESTVPALVHANRVALNRAFRNLIINAATHGQGARVRMEYDTRCVRVIIEDDGPGIPPKLLGQVFEPFFRADPARRQNIAGAGLGLTIAREIVRRSGGDIRILNGEKRGLRQFVELPLSD